MMHHLTRVSVAALVLGGFIFSAGTLHAHGDVNPQPVETEGLPELGEWKDTNPYRDLEGDEYERAITIGRRGYQANCAACHGLGGVSGGIAPDLRMLEPDFDDAYFVEKVRNGARGMPAFEGVLEQEALWAIKTWLETMHEEAMEQRYGR